MEITRESVRGLGPCIYKITSPSGRVYIGQTCNFWRRYRAYRANHSTIACQLKLYRSFRKHGFPSHVFEILVRCAREELNAREIEQIRIHRSFSRTGLNGMGGGNSVHTPSPATIAKRAAKMRGRRCSDETRRKIGQANSGKGNGMFGVPAWNKGVRPSLETIAKIRAANAGCIGNRLGAKHTPAARRLISERTRGKNVGASNPHFGGFIIAHTVSGEFVGRYEGLSAASRALGVHITNVSAVTLGRVKQAKGYVFTREPLAMKSGTGAMPALTPAG